MKGEADSIDPSKADELPSDSSTDSSSSSSSSSDGTASSDDGKEEVLFYRPTASLEAGAGDEKGAGKDQGKGKKDQREVKVVVKKKKKKKHTKSASSAASDRSREEEGEDDEGRGVSEFNRHFHFSAKLLCARARKVAVTQCPVEGNILQGFVLGCCCFFLVLADTCCTHSILMARVVHPRGPEREQRHRMEQWKRTAHRQNEGRCYFLHHPHLHRLLLFLLLLAIQLLMLLLNLRQK